MLKVKALLLLALILIAGLCSCSFGATVTQVAAGLAHTVALKSDGTVWAWGSNYYGQLGDGTTTDRLTPVQVSGLTGVTAIATGVAHTSDKERRHGLGMGRQLPGTARRWHHHQ